MGWVDDLDGRRAGLDSAPLIYALEEHARYADEMRRFLAALAGQRFRVVTSTVTLAEVLTRPLHLGETALVERYETFLLGTRGLDIVDLSVVIAREAARLRATYNLRTPDAVQLATAIMQDASHFLTNDARLSRVSGIRVLILDELA